MSRCPLRCTPQTVSQVTDIPDYRYINLRTLYKGIDEDLLDYKVSVNVEITDPVMPSDSDIDKAISAGIIKRLLDMAQGPALEAASAAALGVDSTLDVVSHDGKFGLASDPTAKDAMDWQPIRDTGIRPSHAQTIQSESGVQEPVHARLMSVSNARPEVQVEFVVSYGLTPPD